MPATPPFDISAAFRTEILTALDEPENNPNFAKLLHTSIC